MCQNHVYVPSWISKRSREASMAPPGPDPHQTQIHVSNVTQREPWPIADCYSEAPLFPE